MFVITNKLDFNQETHFTIEKKTYFDRPPASTRRMNIEAVADVVKRFYTPTTVTPIS